MALSGFVEFFQKGKTFRPKKSFEPGTLRYSLHKQAQASLNSGINLRSVVQLPQGEDINDWTAVHVVDFFNRINLIYGTVSEYCTKVSCPTMSGGPKFEYLWADGGKYKKPTPLPAPQYIALLMDWIESQINNETLFPVSTDVKETFTTYLLRKIVVMNTVVYLFHMWRKMNIVQVSCCCTTIPDHIQPAACEICYCTSGGRYLEHPPYILELASRYFYLFGPLRKLLDDKRFNDNTAVQHAVMTWLQGLDADFFHPCISALVYHWNMYLGKNDVPFPKSFIPLCRKILTRLFRVFVHVYIHHFDRIVAIGAEPHVNTCYKHFYYFVREFDLVNIKELEPLKDMTAHICRDYSEPPTTSS